MCGYFIDTANNLSPTIVEHYFEVRDQWNKKRNNAPDFHGYQDRFDDKRHIVLATDGKRCFGGVRINKSQYGMPLLPMEQHGLRLNRMFPEFELEKKQYVELSKFVVCADGTAFPLQNRVMYDMIHFCLFQMSETKDMHYMFAWSGKAHIRIYQIMGRLFRYHTKTKRVDMQYVPEGCRALGNIHLFALDLNTPLQPMEQVEHANPTYAGEQI